MRQRLKLVQGTEAKIAEKVYIVGVFMAQVMSA